MGEDKGMKFFDVSSCMGLVGDLIGRFADGCIPSVLSKKWFLGHGGNINHVRMESERV